MLEIANLDRMNKPENAARRNTSVQVNDRPELVHVNISEKHVCCIIIYPNRRPC